MASVPGSWGARERPRHNQRLLKGLRAHSEVATAALNSQDKTAEPTNCFCLLFRRHAYWCLGDNVEPGMELRAPGLQGLCYRPFLLPGSKSHILLAPKGSFLVIKNIS